MVVRGWVTAGAAAAAAVLCAALAASSRVVYSSSSSSAAASAAASVPLHQEFEEEQVLKEVAPMAAAVAKAGGTAPASISLWQRVLSYATVPRWRATSEAKLQAAEARILSFVKTPYTQEMVHLPGGPDRRINTISLLPPPHNPHAPHLVCMAGYGASLGFWFKNLDTFSPHFRVHAIDLLGWGRSGRPAFAAKSTAEAESFFVESLEEWRREKGLEKMVLMGHSFGGHIAANYALKYPDRLQHLVLVGPAGVTPPPPEDRLDSTSWRYRVFKLVFEANLTPFALVRLAGPWGPGLVEGFSTRRFISGGEGQMTKEEHAALTDYIYHTVVDKASGELCLKYVFAVGAFARDPLLPKVHNLRVPTSFIYGSYDWMDYRSGEAACKVMAAPGEVIRVPRAGHHVYLDNIDGFHDAVLHACRTLIRREQQAVAGV
eukprot:jgi/Chlat1/3299/Chrsp22S03541